MDLYNSHLTFSRLDAALLHGAENPLLQSLNEIVVYLCPVLSGRLCRIDTRTRACRRFFT